MCRCYCVNDAATPEIYTRSIVGSVRCVQETGTWENKMVSVNDHCMALYILWVAIAFVVITSGRYLKLLSQYWFLVHLALGLAVAVASIILSSGVSKNCLLYTSPSPRDLSTSRMPSSA
eukprot:TRINITY_DN52707_c0_g1_i1.p1 TRINITY_DN52707_c0_g1~~TRINITY_DN52707_c0_g1_i1.p1  ORF type:complete len:119 (+),score=19.35 TRINITY_DN52707_c0_g1_i1:45-401(+)